jgi:hypothetical protein
MLGQVSTPARDGGVFDEAAVSQILSSQSQTISQEPAEIGNLSPESGFLDNMARQSKKVSSVSRAEYEVVDDRVCISGGRGVVRAVGMRSRLLSVCAAAVVLVVVSSGCAAVVKIVLRIATSVIVQEGAEYLRKIFSSDDAAGAPTLMLSFTNASGDGVGEFYAVSGVDGIGIKDFTGEIHLVGYGNGFAVTVAAGTTATIDIVSSGDGNERSVYGDARDQAVTIDGILAWSARSRSDLNNVALPDLHACRNIVSATDTLRSVTDGRARQLDAVQHVDVSALSNGMSIRDALTRALTYSLDADRAFVRWAEQMPPGCGYDSNYDDAARYSDAATLAKAEFVALWNPVARMYGLPPRAHSEV